MKIKLESDKSYVELSSDPSVMGGVQAFCRRAAGGLASSAECKGGSLSVSPSSMPLAATRGLETTGLSPLRLPFLVTSSQYSPFVQFGKGGPSRCMVW